MAALQSQIEVGNLNPANPTVNIKAILAPAWQKDKEIVKSIVTEWKKLTGMNEINAKFRYVQFCRSLKTYGITLFQVKVKDKDKKGKLVNELLGFTRDSIIRLNEDCRTVERTFPLTHLRRWAASNDTFTLDFGSHEDDYVTVFTQEGEAISQLIAGYIDILLKKQRDTNINMDDENGDVANVTEVARVGAMGVMSSTSAMTGKGIETFTHSVVDVDSATRAVNRMINQLFGDVSPEEAGNTALTEQQRRQQLNDHAKTIENLTNKLLGSVTDRKALNEASKAIAVSLENLVRGARNANALGMDPDGLLFDGVKGLADSLERLLAAASDVQKNPNDPEAKARLANAQAAVQAAIARINATQAGNVTDEAYQRLFGEFGKAVNAAVVDMLGTAEGAQISNPALQGQIEGGVDGLRLANQHLLDLTNLLQHVSDPNCKAHLDKGAKGLLAAANTVNATLKSAGISPQDAQAMTAAMARLNEALQGLLGVTDLPLVSGGKAAQDFSTAAQTIIDSTTALMASFGKREVIQGNIATIDGASQGLAQATKLLAATVQDPSQTERLLGYNDQVAEAVRELLIIAPSAIASPSDAYVHAQLRAAAQKVSDATNCLVNDAGRDIAVSSLYSAAKLAAAATTALVVQSQSASQPGRINDPNQAASLTAQAKATQTAVAELIGALKGTAAGQEDPTNTILAAAEKFCPLAYKLVSAAKQASPSISDANAKKNLAFSSDNAAKAIHKLLVTRKATKAKMGQGDVITAMEKMQAAEADLAAALLSAQSKMLERSGVSREDALRDINAAVKAFATATKLLADNAKNSPEEIGASLVQLADALQQVVAKGKSLAGTVEDPAIQRGILNCIGELTNQANQLIQAARASAANPTDMNLSSLLADAGKGVAAALSKLVQASKGVVPKDIEDFQQKAGQDMEDLAQKELEACAKVINRAVAKMKEAQEAAAARAQQPNIDINEANITAAILEACTAIGQATSVLMGAATVVQVEFNKLVKAPATRSVYKRDPAWAQGLISSSQEVAASVQHLVSVSDSSAKGDSSEESLVVAANTVSAATARLVTASRVKSNANSPNQAKLDEAAKSVASATRHLVDAAKEAAQFKDQKEQQEKSKFELSNTVVRQMEEQAEILRLERELEKKRVQFLKNRANNYLSEEDKAGSAAPKQATPAPVAAKPAVQQPPVSPKPAPVAAHPTPAPTGAQPAQVRALPAKPSPAAKSETGKVAWRTSGVHPKQQH